VNNLSFKNEFKRKLIHFASSVIGLSIIYLDSEIMLPILIAAGLIFPFLDYLRINNKYISDFYNSYFHTITRSFELKKLTGASFVFLGALITYVLFDPKVAGIGLIIMSLADANAAIIGVGYGKTKLLNKTLEGSFAFYITTFIILYIFKIPLMLSFLVSLITTLTELIEIPRINDNITIPVMAGLLLTMFGI